MAERVYIGVSPSAFATPGARFRLSFRDILGTLGGMRDARWQPRITRFIETLPGATQLAYAFPPAMSDDVARVAVIDVQLMSQLQGFPVLQVMDRVAAAFPDAHLIRVTLLAGAQNAADRTAGQALELQAALAKDEELDAEQRAGGFFSGILGWLKGAGTWVIIVLALILGIVFYVKKRPGGVL
jgi:hypothetical protein